MHMPGSVVSVTFEGLRTGLFSKRDKILQIQVAVPEEHVNGPDAGQFLVVSMRDAIKLAERRFRKSGIEFDLAANIKWVGEVENAIVAERNA
jgi:hypothetical protein